jgi:ABC-type branched-subunit amino acid transport system ATPase component
MQSQIAQPGHVIQVSVSQDDGSGGEVPAIESQRRCASVVDPAGLHPCPAILETAGLTKEFHGFVAVNDVALQVRAGTIHALIGPNGAGKTTCFNLLTKFLQPPRGTIRFKGKDITHRRPAEVARRGRVLAEGDYAGVAADKEVIAAYLGSADA